MFLAYVPECLFTYAYFEYLMPYFLGTGGAYIFIIYILPKALVEITIMSFLIAALMGNYGFSNFVNKFFAKPYINPKLRTEKTV